MGIAEIFAVGGAALFVFLFSVCIREDVRDRAAPYEQNNTKGLFFEGSETRD